MRDSFGRWGDELPESFVVKSSGNKEIYDTGAQRDSRTDKGRYDLIPPDALRRLALVYERGAKYYGDRNWEKGIPLSRYFDSALRHLNQALSGELDEDHLAQAAFNIFAIIHHQEQIRKGDLPKELDDLPKQFKFEELLSLKQSE